MGNSLGEKISRARESDARRKKGLRRMALAAAGVCAVVFGGGAAAYFYVWPWLGGAPAVTPAVTVDRAPQAPAATNPADNPLREQYKSQLKIFHSETEPALAAVSASVWAADAHELIFDGKEKSLRAFDAGNYSSALGLLQNAQTTAGGILRQAEERFRVNIKAAADAFDANDHQTAAAAVTTALLLKPQHAAARELRGRIDVLPRVLELLQTAAQARAENRPRAEQKALAEVVQLDPARNAARQRLQTVTSAIAERAFTENITAGFGALEKRDLASALRHWNAAKKVFPGREEAAVLGREINDLDRALTLQKHLRAGARAAAEDDWDGALQAFQQAGKIDAVHAEAVAGEKRARAILSARKNMNSHIARPQRLFSPNVAAAAEKILHDARKLYPFSPSLARRGEKLTGLLAAARRPATVTVHSDNQTDIRVRGVGVIGKTERRTLELRPGVYTFEGRRRGYRSKLVTLTVRHDRAPLAVTVVCDEQI